MEPRLYNDTRAARALRADDATPEVIGELIRDLRRNAHVSQDQLAKHSDVERSTVAGVEQGRKNITVFALNRILRALDISWDEFVSMLAAALKSKSTHTT